MLEHCYPREHTLHRLGGAKQCVFMHQCINNCWICFGQRTFIGQNPGMTHSIAAAAARIMHVHQDRPLVMHLISLCHPDMHSVLIHGAQQSGDSVLLTMINGDH